MGTMHELGPDAFSWRVQRRPSNSGGRQHRSSNARDKPPGNVSHETNHTATATPTSSTSQGNVWVPSERASRTGPPSGPAEDRHVSVGGFDGQEARDLLRRGRIGSSV